LTMTATRRRTRSAAKPGSRSGSLFAHTNLVEPLAECRQPRCARLRTTRVEISDHRHPLLRPRGKRPTGRAADQRDECAALHVRGHAITWSAGASTVGGSSMLRALAVLRLSTVSYFVAACTGRSAAFSPLRMRST